MLVSTWRGRLPRSGLSPKLNVMDLEIPFLRNEKIQPGRADKVLKYFSKSLMRDLPSTVAAFSQTPACIPGTSTLDCFLFFSFRSDWSWKYESFLLPFKTQIMKYYLKRHYWFSITEIPLHWLVYPTERNIIYFDFNLMDTNWEPFSWVEWMVIIEVKCNNFRTSYSHLLVNTYLSVAREQKYVKTIADDERLNVWLRLLSTFCQSFISSHFELPHWNN